MSVRPPKDQAASGQTLSAIHPTYRVRSVYFITDASSKNTPQDTVSFDNINIIYGKDRYIKPKILEEKCFIQPGDIYRADATDRTYESLAQLGILRSINIEMKPAGHADGQEWLDAYILLTRNKNKV